MKELRQFIQENTVKLLDLLDVRQSKPLDTDDSLTFVNDILDDFFVAFNDQTLPSPTRTELTFWFTLYQLEESVEVATALSNNPRQIQSILPYQKLVEETLAITRTALRQNNPLPSQFDACRPGELGAELDDDEDMWDLDDAIAFDDLHLLH